MEVPGMKPHESLEVLLTSEQIDARIDELDIEGVLAFAEHLLLNV